MRGDCGPQTDPDPGPGPPVPPVPPAENLNKASLVLGINKKKGKGTGGDPQIRFVKSTLDWVGPSTPIHPTTQSCSPARWQGLVCMRARCPARHISLLSACSIASANNRTDAKYGGKHIAVVIEALVAIICNQSIAMCTLRADLSCSFVSTLKVQAALASIATAHENFR